jgi:site-specific recombinase XerD
VSSTELVVVETGRGAVVTGEPGAAGELAPLDGLRERVGGYLRAGKSDNTRRAYRSDFEHFAAWCRANFLEALPAASETVALYLADCAGNLAVSTLRRRLAAISQVHQAAGYDNPAGSILVVEAMKGIVRTHGSAGKPKTPAVTHLVAAMIKPLGTDVRDCRDRALILLGFAGAMRRSELVALDVGDVTETAVGLRIQMRRSKTDQQGRGDTIGIMCGSDPRTCPVRSWRAWLDAAGIDSGPAFRRRGRHGQVTEHRLSADYVLRIVKERAAAAGFARELFGAHSLRSGFATTAFRAGVAERRIMVQGRWTTTKSMHGYIQEGELFVDNPSAKLGL